MNKMNNKIKTMLIGAMAIVGVCSCSEQTQHQHLARFYQRNLRLSEGRRDAGACKDTVVGSSI